MTVTSKPYADLLSLRPSVVTLLARWRLLERLKEPIWVRGKGDDLWGGLQILGTMAHPHFTMYHLSRP